MDNLFGMGIELTANSASAVQSIDAYNTALSQAKQKSQDFVSQSSELESAMSGLGTLATTMTGIGLSLTVAGDQALNAIGGFKEAAKSYESELATLKFVTQATGEEWDALTAKAEEAGMLTQFSPEEAVQGLYELKSAGLSTADAISALDATMDFSTMSNGAVQLDQSASLIASTMNKFNLSAENAYHIADVFSTATQESAYHAEDLASFINSIGAMPSTLGVSLEEIMGMGSLLMNIGQGSAQAGATVQGFGRQIKLLTAQIQSGGLSKKKASAMELLGIDLNTFWDEEGELRSMVDIFNEIVAGAGDLNSEQKSAALQTLFATQAGNLETAIEQAQQSYMTYNEAGELVVDENSQVKKSLDELIKKYQECDGVTAEGAEMMRQTAKGMEELANGAVQTLQIKLGEATPAFDKFFSTLKYKVSNALIQLIDNHPALAKFATTVVALGGGLMKIAGIGALAVAAVAGLALGALSLAKNLQAIKAGLVVLKGFALQGVGALSSLMATIAPLLVVAGLLYAAWKTDFAGLRTTVLGFVENVKTSFATAKNLTQMGIDDFLSETRRLEESGNWWDWLSLKIMDFMLFFQGIADAWADNTLSDEMFTKLEERGLLPFVEFVLDMKEVVLSVWEGIKEGFQDFSDTAQSALEAVGDAIGWLLEPLGDLLGVDLSGVGESLSKVFGGDGVDKEFWKSVGHFIGEAVGVVFSFMLAWKVVIPVISTVWKLISGIVSVVGKLFGVVKTVISFLINNPIVMVITGVITAIMSFVDMLKNGFSVVKEVIMLVGIALATVGAILLGVAALPAVIVGAIVAAVMTIVVVVKQHWEQIKAFFAKIGGWIKANVIDPVVQFFVGLWNSITEIVRNIVDGIVAFFTPIVEFIAGIVNVIVGIVRAVIAVIVGIVELLYIGICTVIYGLIQFFQMVWDGIVAIFNWVVNLLITIFTPVVQGIQFIWGVLVGFFQSLWAGIQAIFSAVVGFLSTLFAPVVQGIQSAWSVLTGFFSGLWNGIKGVFSTVASFFSGVFQSAYNAITSVFGGIASWFSNIWSGVVSGVKGFINSMVGAINTVIGGLNKLSFTVPDWVPGLGGKQFGFNIPTVPTLAVGTDNWQGGVAQISEKGGEIVDLPAGSRVYPNDETVQKSYQDGANSVANALIAKIDQLLTVLASMGGTSGGGSNVYFEAGSIVAQVEGSSVDDLENLVDKIMEIIKRKQELEGIRNFA